MGGSRNIARAIASPIMPTPPSADQQQRAALGGGHEPLERRIGGEAGAHQRSGEIRRQRRVVDQIARMRNQHMGGDNRRRRRCRDGGARAQILLAGAAGRALCRNRSTDRPRRDVQAAACGRRPRALDYAGDLVAKRERQRAARADVEPFVVAEHEIAVLHVQVGMADAAALNAHQYFVAFRGGASATVSHKGAP